MMYEGVSESFRTGHLERDCKWYSSLPLGAVISLSEFCRHNPLCWFSMSVYCCLFRYRLSPYTFVCTRIYILKIRSLPFCILFVLGVHSLELQIQYCNANLYGLYNPQLFSLCFGECLPCWKMFRMNVVVVMRSLFSVLYQFTVWWPTSPFFDKVH